MGLTHVLPPETADHQETPVPQAALIVVLLQEVQAADPILLLLQETADHQAVVLQVALIAAHLQEVQAADRIRVLPPEAADHQVAAAHQEAHIHVLLQAQAVEVLQEEVVILQEVHQEAAAVVHQAVHPPLLQEVVVAVAEDSCQKENN